MLELTAFTWALMIPLLLIMLKLINGLKLAVIHPVTCKSKLLANTNWLLL